MFLAVDFIVHVCALVSLLKKKALSQYFTLVVYLCASVAAGIGRTWILKTVGLASSSYLYFYFYSDALLTICLYFVLMTLYSHVFSEMGVGQQVRACALLLLGGTVAVSYYMVASSSDRLITHFVLELAQNLYFVGVVLTYLLWGAMVKLRENRTRLMQIVLCMGVYFSLSAASYALGNLYPETPIWRYWMQAIDMCLPAAWMYAFLKVPEDARTLTARVVAPSR